MNVIHELKTWPEYFNAVEIGEKKFELRYNDRGFRVGDILHLREWLPGTKQYTGRECKAKISYILDLDEYLYPDGRYPEGSKLNYVVMSIETFDDLPF